MLKSTTCVLLLCFALFRSVLFCTVLCSHPSSSMKLRNENEIRKKKFVFVFFFLKNWYTKLDDWRLWWRLWWRWRCMWAKHFQVLFSCPKWEKKILFSCIPNHCWALVEYLVLVSSSISNFNMPIKNDLSFAILSLQMKTEDCRWMWKSCYKITPEITSFFFFSFLFLFLLYLEKLYVCMCGEQFFSICLTAPRTTLFVAIFVFVFSCDLRSRVKTKQKKRWKISIY